MRSGHPPEDPLVGRLLLPGLIVTLVAAPLAFGAVQPWAFAGAFVLVAALFAAQLLRREVVVATPPLVAALGLAGLLVALQLLPALGPLTVNRHASFEALLKGTCYTLTFLLAARVGRRRTHARWLLAALVAVATFEALYGLAEQSSGTARIFGFRKPTGGTRASGTYVNSNHFAGLLAMALPVAVGLLASWRWRDRLPTPLRARLVVMLGHPTFPGRALLATAILLVSVGLLGSLSRGGVLAALVGLGALALALVPAHRRLRVGGVATALVLVFGLTLASSVVERLVARLDGLSRETSLTTATRLAIARDTLALIGEHPLLGAGAGTYGDAFASHQSFDSRGLHVDHAHCDYLELATDLGLPGALALLLGLAATCALIVRRATASNDAERGRLALTALAGVAAIACHSWVDFNLRIPANALWATALLGLAWGLSSAATGFRPLRSLSAPWSRVLFVALTLAALAALSHGAIQLARGDWAAAPFIERAQPDRRSLEARLQALEAANAHWPFCAEHHLQLGWSRWELMLAAARREADAASLALVDPDETPERLRQQVAEHIMGLLLSQPAVRAESATVLCSLARARALAPLDPRAPQATRAVQQVLSPP